MKVLIFLLCLLPWFLSSLITIDTSFYITLKLPLIAPPPIVFSVIWPGLYLLIAISIFLIVKNKKFKDISKSYKLALFINYICNQTFIIGFFTLKSLMLGFLISTLTLISSIFLYTESRNENELSATLLSPYILWNLFASFLSLTIYALNI